jgi:hypothetical protein
MVDVQQVLSLRFAETVRRLVASARPLGLATPTFRSPPGLAGATRTIRRRPDGAVVVAVAVRDRPWAVVEDDLIEGIVRTNALGGPAAERCRTALRSAMAEASGPVAAAGVAA